MVKPALSTEFRVRCAECSHQWTAAYLPQTLASMAILMKHLHCPKCASGANRIFYQRGE